MRLFCEKKGTIVKPDPIKPRRMDCSLRRNALSGGQGKNRRRIFQAEGRAKRAGFPWVRTGLRTSKRKRLRFALQNAFGENRCFSAEACGAAIWRLPLSAETAKRVKCYAFALYGFGFQENKRTPKNRFALAVRFGAIRCECIPTACRDLLSVRVL